ncbi:hypothetical protein HYX07_02080 [Candidatus Woesearchaeota archaeon]|nr:hypothetical protein [Candidatus Woesearchaeota archaeon]
MTDLVACLSTGEKSRAHVSRLVNDADWNNVFLVTNDFGKENFRADRMVEFIVVDFQKPVFELIEDIKKGLRGKISDLEVALNIVSGSGKEHMAILSALLKLGVGVRLMAVTKEGIKEL